MLAPHATGTAQLPHNVRMLEPLRTWAAPYGGDALIYLTVLAIASLVALFALKARLDTALLRRFIRLSALIALPLTLVSVEMGDNHWGIAAVALVWCITVGITSKNEITRREIQKK